MNKLDKYLAVRDQMQTGDLLQWRSNSVIGAMIRWRTQSEVNHSSLIIRLKEYDDETKRRFTSEALEHGIVLNLLSRRLESHDGECWWYPLRDEWSGMRPIIGKNALYMLGIPYDYKSIFQQLFGRVSADARALFCSEYCYLSYGFHGQAPTPAEMPKMGIYKEPVLILESNSVSAGMPEIKSNV